MTEFLPEEPKVYTKAERKALIKLLLQREPYAREKEVKKLPTSTIERIATNPKVR